MLDPLWAAAGVATVVTLPGGDPGVLFVFSLILLLPMAVPMMLAVLTRPPA